MPGMPIKEKEKNNYPWCSDVTLLNLEDENMVRNQFNSKNRKI